MTRQSITPNNKTEIDHNNKNCEQFEISQLKVRRNTYKFQDDCVDEIAEGKQQ